MKSRIRTVKPELFTNTQLHQANQQAGCHARESFVGLLCYADREGRFKWNPIRLKVLILPYDDVDFELILNALADNGLVRRYRVEGEDYGEIVNFKKHQKINSREAESKLPGPELGEVQASADARTEINLRADARTEINLRARKFPSGTGRERNLERNGAERNTHDVQEFPARAQESGFSVDNSEKSTKINGKDLAKVEFEASEWKREPYDDSRDYIPTAQTFRDRFQSDVSKPFVPPSVEDILKHLSSSGFEQRLIHGSPADLSKIAKTISNHYSAKNWMYGKIKMYSWGGAVENLADTLIERMEKQSIFNGSSGLTVEEHYAKCMSEVEEMQPFIDTICGG